MGLGQHCTTVDKLLCVFCFYWLAAKFSSRSVKKPKIPPAAGVTGYTWTLVAKMPAKTTAQQDVIGYSLHEGYSVPVLLTLLC